MNGVERGSLIIADISGYTTYLRGVELEHSTDILADLINTIVAQMAGHFTLAKLEGDAIFAYASDTHDPDAATLVTTIESCFFAFAGRQRTIDQATSCTCDACSKIPTLNLKFVIHHGRFAIHEVAGSRELVGPDVIVVHRLLKNDIKEKTGVEAYAFFSGDCTEHYGLDATALTLRPHTETYDDVGEIPGWVLDLESRWREEQARRSIYIGADDAMVEMQFELPAPPPVLWEHMTSPTKRLAWQTDTVDMFQQNPRGAPGVGTVNHCVHGDSTVYEEILDWKPYRYYTDRTTIMEGISLLFMVEFEPLEQTRTQMTVRMKPESEDARQAMDMMGEGFRTGFEQGMTKLSGILTGTESAATTG